MPVTGSQPFVVSKPASHSIITPSSFGAQNRLEPLVISLNFEASEYNIGLINPTVVKPFAFRNAFTCDK